MTAHRDFYDEHYAQGRYTAGLDPRYGDMVSGWIARFGLDHVEVLEVGCGLGFLSNLVPRWTGLDLSVAAGSMVRGRFVAGSPSQLPFPSATFGAIWSVDTLEHVPELERCLSEMGRVLRPGGALILRPAWFCRPWAAGGYEVRPYSALTLQERLIKASIPVRNSLLFRLPGVLLRRLAREARALVAGASLSLDVKRLSPNLEVFWQSDSDACNAIDPHEVVLWFRARG